MLAVALGSFSLVILDDGGDDDSGDEEDGAGGGMHSKFHIKPFFAQLLLLLSLATPRWLWISTIEAIPARFGTDHSHFLF